MTKPELHPWLSTPEAVKAAHAAVRTPATRLPVLAQIGRDELFSEALTILTECALPPRDRGHFACAQCGSGLENVRAGAKFCGPDCRYKHANSRRGSEAAALPATPKSHIGSMYSWPEAERFEYAVRQVGYALCNWLRTRPREFATEDRALDRALGGKNVGILSAYGVLLNREYEQALEAFEATGRVPWDLLDIVPLDHLGATGRPICAQRSAA